MEKHKSYGKELILDLHDCNSRRFSRKMIGRYFREVCDLIDMKRCELFWWDDYGLPAKKRQTEPHLKGTSAVQFIMTSNITIHTLDILKNVYLNIFSCKDFDAHKATEFSRKFFQGKVVNVKVVERK
ncbi:MAG: S-adenosylmethionine decarboxylase [Candidatus Colwellbacteria bacterium CG_4_9_14_0_2_um_filter_50_12]|uniref:S-adenosylmethionine decarboxylase n=1 Tax=Candidatus Colwellbacteria bacterium CG_4_9_14_0_2_um_filter_50_12 TaxID=1974538 RepID=A0A2M8G101_9BACT|nr:MAG: S-adenosylmethionine decarboxylase [Candidatus Colwellbacteria bacterium CG_4_9_14_0_2_um_filter_50_12]